MRIIVFMALAVCLSMPAQAQSKKELAAQNAALAERLLRLENRMLTGDPAAERLMQRMDTLEASQRTLTGEVERLRFERDNLRAELAALNEAIRDLETLAARTQTHLDAVDMLGRNPQPAPPRGYTYEGPSTPGQAGDPQLAGGVSPQGQPSAVPSAPVFREMTIPVQEDYQALSLLPAAGKQKLAEGDYAGAQIDFKTYLTAMPDAPNAGEISYWLGETFYVRQGYADAADAYITSMRKSPQGIKAPDAMVKLAAALRGLGKQTEACQTLDSFPAQYPNAPANVREKARTESIRAGC